MIIHKKLKLFLEKIYIKNLDFSQIKENELRKCFKNNEYYNLKSFCLENELIDIEYHKINLTNIGINLFNILKKMKKI
jgi:hypothetical protein